MKNNNILHIISEKINYLLFSEAEHLSFSVLFEPESFGFYSGSIEKEKADFLVQKALPAWFSFLEDFSREKKDVSFFILSKIKKIARLANNIESEIDFLEHGYDVLGNPCHNEDSISPIIVFRSKKYHYKGPERFIKLIFSNIISLHFSNEMIEKGISLTNFESKFVIDKNIPLEKGMEIQDGGYSWFFSDYGKIQKKNFSA